MVSVNEAGEALVRLGARLRAARIERNEPMAVFAERIGVSVPTLRAMERGSATVQIGFWMKAFWALDRIDEVGALFAERDSLIERAKRARSPVRRRASRKPRAA